MSEERVVNINVAARPPPTPPNHPPMVPLFFDKFVSRVDKIIYDLPYCSRDLTDAPLLAHMDSSHPQKIPYRL